MKQWWVPGLQIGYEHSFVHQVADFLENLAQGRSTSPTFREALATQAVCDTGHYRCRYFTWGAFAVFVILLGVTMCTGHSVGFHRRLIHRTFQCPKWLERLLVWSGTLVGMQGPFWVIQSHDFRDWAQRQPDCHPYLRHGQGMLKDAFWNLHCRLKLRHPPGFDPGPGIGDDSFYRFLQRTWMLQQLPVALALYAIGGIPWVVWGVCVRVTTGVSMHWFVGYICHSHGPQSWIVNNGAVQAHNVPWAAIPSMGESWHNNHHAFPASALHGPASCRVCGSPAGMPPFSNCDGSTPKTSDRTTTATRPRPPPPNTMRGPKPPPPPPSPRRSSTLSEGRRSSRRMAILVLGPPRLET